MTTLTPNSPSRFARTNPVHPMHTLHRWILLPAACLLSFSQALVAAEDAGLTSLQGRWTVSKTSPEGQAYVQKLEIRKGKLTFRMLNSDGDLKLIAKGDVKTEKLGGFNVLHLTGIEAGQSEDALKSIGDERASIYLAGDDTLTLASNLDKERENQKPSLDVYKLEPGSRTPPVEGAAKVVGVWKMEVVLGESTREYELHIAESDGQLGGKMISTKSGEHKIKALSMADGKLKMEVDREYQGTPLTVLYSGTVEDGKLSGTFAVKDHEAEYNGKWSAKKP